MVTQPQQRQDTLARRQAALQRAIAEGIEVRQLADSGQWIATSGSDQTVAYPVTLQSCKCQAGEHDDPVCKHREALRLSMARLAVGEVEALGWDAPDCTVDLAVRAANWLIAVGLVPSLIPCPLCGATDPRCGLCGGEGEVSNHEPTDGVKREIDAPYDHAA